MSGSLDKIARLTIEITPRVAGATGIQELDRVLASFEKGSQRQVAQARVLADAQIREAQRAQTALIRANQEVARSYDSYKDLALRQEQALAEGRIKIAQATAYRMQQIQDRMLVQQADANRLALNNQAAQQSAVQAQQRVANAQRSGAVGGMFSAAGTAFMGAGAVGVIAGGASIRSAMNWQTFVSQNISNSPMTPREQQAFQQLALQIATQTGANPQDVFKALRYGSEMGLNMQADRRYLTAALALGLPTGGSAAVPTSLMALGTVRKNFPQYGNNPTGIANMVLAASQNSAGVSVSDFVGAMPEILGIAGHIGGKDQLQQSLAMFAALTSAGMPLSVANTQIKNLITKILKPSTLKWISGFDKLNGTNLAGDFGYQALHTKGLSGVIGNIAQMGLNLTQIGYLFPNLRGYIGALGLTGNQSTSFTNILGQINNSPKTNPLGANFERYLGLDSTEAAKLTQQLKVLSITVGTELLPPFNSLLKDEIVPGVNDLSAFVRQNKSLVDGFIQLSPWLLGIGIGFKGLSVIGTATGNLQKFIGMISLATMGSGGMPALSGGLGTVATDAENAAGKIGMIETATEGLTIASVAGPLAGIAAIAAAFYLVSQHAKDATLAVDGLIEHLHKGGSHPFGPNSPDMGTILLSALDLPVAIASGKAGDIWQYITTGKVSSSGAPHASGNVNDSMKDYRIAAGPYPSGVFGLNGGQLTYGSLNPNSAGIWIGSPTGGHWVNAKQDPTVFHWDLGTAGQVEKVKMEPGTYKVAGMRPDQQDPGTWDITFETPNGGYFTMMHMDQVAARWTIGDTVTGGQIVGLSNKGAAHVHVGGDNKAFTYLASHDPRLAQIGANPQNVTGGGPFGWSGINLPKVETPFGNAFVSAGGQKHVDPAVLAGIGMAESSGAIGSGYVSSSGYGTMGASARKYGSNAGGQIAGASDMLSQYVALAMQPGYFNKHQGPARQVLARLGIKNPSRNEIALVIALAFYNAGPNGPNVDNQGSNDGDGMGYAYKVLSSAMRANGGAFPATYWTGQGSSRVPTTSGGASSHYTNPTPGSGKVTFDPSQAQTALDAITKPYRNADGTINFSKMPSQVRQEADTLIRLVAGNNLNLGPIGNALNNAVAAGLITKGQGDQAYQNVAKMGASANAHPESWYNSKHRARAKTPAQWASYWSARETKDKKTLSDILKPYRNADGTVNWGSMPKAVRAAADHYIQLIGGDDYMMQRGTLNADISDPKVRSILMGQAWSGPNGYMSSYRNPEAWWDALNGKSSASGASSAAQAWHIIGRNCEAAQHALAPIQKTAVKVTETANAAAQAVKLLEGVLAELQTHTKIHQATSKWAGRNASTAAAKAIGVSVHRQPGR